MVLCLTLDHCGTHRATSQGTKVSGGQIFISLRTGQSSAGITFRRCATTNYYSCCSAFSTPIRFERHYYGCTPTVTHLGFCLLSRYDSRPEVPERELTDLERAEGGRGFIPPLHSAVEMPGTQDARKRLSLDFRMVCLLPLQPPEADTVATTCTQSARGKQNPVPKL